VFEVSALTLFLRLAEFLQLKEPATLFYLFLIMASFYMTRKSLLSHAKKLTWLEKEVIRLNGEIVKNQAVIRSQEHRENMQKALMTEQEKRHTQYRKDMSDINSRIDGIKDAQRDTA
jgi:hypothetical protein